MIDTHVHLAAADLARYPHAEKPPFETELYVHTADDLLASMQRTGVDHATVVQPFGIYGTDNSYHADSAASHLDRLSGVCGVAPTAEGADQLRYWVGERGMAGGRLATLGQGVSLGDDGFAHVLQAAAALDVPVCLLTSRKHVADLPGLARRVPGARIVLDHLGTSGAVRDVDALIQSVSPLATIDNVFLKISTQMLASGDDGRRILEVILEQFGPSRIVWGTNYPVTDLGGYAQTVDESRRALAFLSDDERDAVFDRTARQLWRLPRRDR